MKNYKTIIFTAPLSGVIYPIEKVPDPVFSQKMVGDGLSIDPTTHQLCAPIDGIVIQIHAALHAVTLRHSSGLEVMMHIGLDTVVLESKGFKAEIIEGQQVYEGDTLITFDMDYIATHAKSLLTQIIILNGELVKAIEKSKGMAECGISRLFSVTIDDSLQDLHGVKKRGESRSAATSQTVMIPNPTGLHARPAALLASMSKGFDATVRLIKGEESADAKSIVSILALDLQYQDSVKLSASGSDAKEAIDTIIPHLQRGFEEESESIPSRTKEDSRDHPEPIASSDDPSLLIGVGASPGIAVGVAFSIKEREFDFPEEARDAQAESIRFDRAIDEAKIELENLHLSLSKQTNGDEADIFMAHLEILNDPHLIQVSRDMIDRGKSAEYSWQQAYILYAKQLEGLQNRLIAQRANDINDVGIRLLNILTGQASQSIQPQESVILIAEELTPSSIVKIDTQKVKGFCTTLGGATSHVAIIARSLGIPAIVGIDRGVLKILDGQLLILDGDRGELRVDPPPTLIAKALQKQESILKERAQNLKLSSKPAATTDGKPVEISTNISSLDDAIRSVQYGADGVGLLRSELLFIDRLRAPTEDEQYEIYRDIVLALEGRPLVIRTLDVGGDKPLAWLPLPKEENPFLGERGIRIALEQPEIFNIQARAILRASIHGKIRIMFPMISMIDELIEIKSMLEHERQKLGIPPIEVGIMVEVPSTAIMAEQFAKEVDFFSIGTNDLTQYTLAMDRDHPKLATKIDTLNPAVLRLIKQTADGAHIEGKWVGICGSIASDPQALPILLGLGIDELSVTIPILADIKAQVRRLSMGSSQEIAQKCLDCQSAKEVHKLLRLPQ
ncbi:MAG: phosphoenolpyruvate--protein phosphotransferase [Campylobacterota bacterium]|nr:phosphoenolpyruvate--protein phosphotransferase [Campylobacterota bacterium]